MAFDNDDDAVPTFDSAQEELHFWKTRADKLQTTLRDTDSTLKEFEESSKELEKEMERELNAATNKANDLQVKAEKLKGDVDEWKGKYQRALSDHNKSLAELNRELTTLRDSHNAYKNKLRDMELDNDELENAERMVASSLQDMETRYNKAIERTALLEEELVEKSRLEEENQRLKDELQEVNEELAVLRDRMEPRNPAPSTNMTASVDESFMTQRSDQTSVSRAPQTSSLSRASGAPATAVSRSTRPAASRASLAAITARHSPESRGTAAFRSGNSNGSSPRSAINTLPSSPPVQALRNRQALSVRPSLARTRVTGTASSSRGQGTSMQKMAGLLRNLRDLQATVHSATRMTADVPSAIPRPSSRMSTSHAYVPPTPRRSAYDARRDDVMSPSSIPIPSTGLSRASMSSMRPASRLGAATERPSSRIGMSDRPASRIGADRPVSRIGADRPASRVGADRPASRLGIPERPSSRLSATDRHHVPSIRAQTPSNFEHATLDFLDHDPAKHKRRSQQALGSSSAVNVASSSSSSGSTAHDRDIGNRSLGHISRPRGSSVTTSVRDSQHYTNMATLSSATGVGASSRIRDRELGGSEGGTRSTAPSHSVSALHSLRKSTHPRTGKPVPPPSASVMRYPSLSRHRVGASIDYGRTTPGDLGASGSQSVDV